MDNYDQLIITAPCHIHSHNEVQRAMFDVVISLVPALIAATIFFGLNALFLCLVCVLASCFSEIIVKRLLGRPITLWDGSAIVTGILLCFTLPPSTPWWIAAIGAFVAIAIAKELFGGLGHNIFNPALFGRIFIFLIPGWRLILDNYVQPFWWVDKGFFNIISTKANGTAVSIINLAGGHLDSITRATPLFINKTYASGYHFNLNLLWGNIPGSIGETSVIALLIGAAYLFYKGHISWRIPTSIIATVFVASILLGQNPFFHIFAGGLILGAFFMATDWVTCPLTAKGQLIYGFAIGIFIIFTRRFGIKAEGVGLAILHLNPLALFIDRYTLPKKFGG